MDFCFPSFPGVTSGFFYAIYISIIKREWKMRTIIKKTALLFIALSSTLFIFGQQAVIRGVVRDQSNRQPVATVSIQVNGSTEGIVTDANGTFNLPARAGSYVLVFTHLSFNEKKIEVSVEQGKTLNIGTIFLDPKVIGLEEVHIISSFISDQNTPVAVTTISSKTIENQMGNQDYPEILKLTPGTYVTKAGGGSGDDRLTIRGFQQENVALLLNGIPVSSMENGLVYWSNWVGLTDATEAIQVQRGLGASKVAMNSVGGTINIITKSTQSVKGGVLRYSLSNYGNQKTSLQLSTGQLAHNVAITFLGSRTQGPGYVDGTYVNGWSYFLSVSKVFNSRHTLVFTALGSPEHHGQRNYGISHEEYQKYGNRYNPSWGIYNGKVLNLSENYYHKPQINLNHYWTINPRMFLASSAYVSFGHGGGRYTEAFNYGTSLFYMKKNNQVDFDAAYENNLNNRDSVQLVDGLWMKNYSKNILTNYRANHYWAGILSTLNYSLNDKVKIVAGAHLRTFKSRLFEDVDDLMGGAYWIEQYAWSMSGVAGRNQVKKVGDVINVDNYSMMNYGNLFGQIEYQSGKLSGFGTATFSTTSYRRKDPYNYLSDPYSEKVIKSGFDAKLGLNYELIPNLSFYGNFGYYSREPYYKFVFVDFSNDLAQDLRNEKITAIEAGLLFTNGRFSTRANTYYTLWKDKALLSRENIQLEDSTLTRALVKGLNALHKGLEIESNVLLKKNLSISASFSWCNWRWKNDVDARIYNDKQVLVDTVKVYIKDLLVGDAPQTQIGVSVDYTFLEQLNLVANWVYYDRLYANFDPAIRTKKEDRTQSYRIPDYGMVDLYLGYNFEVKGVKSTFQLSCQNVLDKEAITRGDDGVDHTLDTFSGFWSQGRTFNVSMKLEF
jgi:iron complex outermembrane recepter protein